jgi:hypothetical protein
MFNSEWFLQLLTEQILKTNNKQTILNLFCVNRACAKFARSRTKYEIKISDDSCMPCYFYNYIFDTYFDALFNLSDIIEEHSDILPYHLYFVIHYVYPRFSEDPPFSYYSNSNLNYTFPFRLKRKRKIKNDIVHVFPSDLGSEIYYDEDQEIQEFEPKEYSNDDMIPWLEWKKGVILDEDLDPKSLWNFEDT